MSPCVVRVSPRAAASMYRIARADTRWTISAAISVDRALERCRARMMAQARSTAVEKTTGDCRPSNAAATSSGLFSMGVSSPANLTHP